MDNQEYEVVGIDQAGDEVYREVFDNELAARHACRRMNDNDERQPEDRIYYHVEQWSKD